MIEPVTIGPCRLFNADCRSVLPTLASDSVDSVVCDPPYELGFMGRQWDASGIAHNVEMWREVLRVLKPGGHLLAFGGTRTYHRMTCAIEDAGFEIRDCIQWLYGSGFPKSLDVSKAIDKAAGAEREVVGERPWTNAKMEAGNGVSGLKQAGGFAGEYESERVQVPVTAPATPEAEQWQGWGTALKPANEPIVVARKPIEGTVAANVLKHGTGAINVDACRVGTAESWAGSEEPSTSANGYGPGDADGWKGNWTKRSPSNPSGRWPANVIHDGSEEVLEAFAAFGERPGAVSNGKSGVVQYGSDSLRAMPQTPSFGDSGSAARFFYCAKASKEERGDENKHSTVKPLALARYLVRLVTPPGGTVLTPFLGSGTEIVGAVKEGVRGIGIELDADSFETACRRIRDAVREDRESLFSDFAKESA